ncbi:hypothetical protein [Pseudomonas phage D6]|nr:hypothetical protein [Pseudomonas phage D6]
MKDEMIWAAKTAAVLGLGFLALNEIGKRCFCVQYAAKRHAKQRAKEDKARQQSLK